MGVYYMLTSSTRWAAICRGAVMKGLGNDIVLNYKSRYNYGTVFMEDFDERIHLAIDRETDDVRNIPIAKNQMDWFLLKASIFRNSLEVLLKCCTKGQNVEKDEPVTDDFFCPVRSREQMSRFEFNILFSETPKAEKRTEPSESSNTFLHVLELMRLS